MEAGRTQALVSVEQSQQAGESLKAIAEAIGTIRGMNVQISTTVDEQLSVADEINQSMARIAQAAESSAVGAEQTIHTSDELGSLANELQGQVAVFKIA